MANVSDTALGLIPRDEWEEGVWRGRLRVRARDGPGWLEQEFEVEFI